MMKLVILYLRFFLLTVSAPAATPRGGDKEVSGTYNITSHVTTCLRRLQKPHPLQSFPSLPWTVEDRPRQEDA